LNRDSDVKNTANSSDLNPVDYHVGPGPMGLNAGKPINTAQPKTACGR